MKTHDLGLATYLYALGHIPEIEGIGQRKTFVFTGTADYELLKGEFMHYEGKKTDCRSYFEAISALKVLLYS